MTLDNVEAINAAHPDTFEIPSRDDRAALRPNDLAKIIMTDEDDTERFWVKVTATTPGGRYVGSVDNHIVCFDLPVGYPIEFGPEHVASIITSDTGPAAA